MTDRREYTVNCEAPTQRALVRAWNRIAPTDAGSDFLDAGRLHEIAARATGLDDFGPETYCEPMERFAASLRETANLHAFGQYFAKRMFLMGLTNRLLVEHAWKRCPEARDAAVSTPIFILGMPRTGTTHLYSLLAQDPAHRYLTHWEATEPVPPPGRVHRTRRMRRIRGRFRIGFFKYLAPSYATIYPLRLDGPEECGALAMNEFAFPLYHEMFNVPGYIDWISTYDFRPLLRYHRRQIQLLHAQRPGERWVLKSPYLIAALPALLEAYPDALVVQTHRDPVKAVPSICSMWASFRGISSRALDAREIGRQVVETIAFDLRRGMRERASLDPARFHDVRYDTLVANPIGTVREIYERAGVRLTDVAEQRMRALLSEQPTHAPGTHRYSMSQFGLDAPTIREAFAEYCEYAGPHVECDA